MLPKSSIAARCLTITFRRAMCAAPAGERDGRDHRQEFGRQADRERHREEQRLEKRAHAAARRRAARRARGRTPCA